MSISETILHLKQSRQLHLLTPKSSSDSRFRQLYLTDRFREELFKDRTTAAETQRFADLEADLEVFVNRRLLEPHYLYRLSPKGCGVWEIRSAHDPQIRVFGMFMLKDTLVVTHYVQRDVLGARTSDEWKTEIRYCQTFLRNLFPSYTPIKSIDVNKVISGATNESYFKD